jgi:hypothetical protein
LGKNSGLLFRFGTKRFAGYNRWGRRVNVLGKFKGLQPGESGEQRLYYEYEGEYQPLRLCVLRKTKAAEENKELRAAQRAYNRYVIVVTLITDADPELLLDGYRQGWQIQMAFKRLKSLCKYHQIPVHVAASVRAWFYGKLLPAALGERWVNEGRFSPSAAKCSG